MNVDIGQVDLVVFVDMLKKYCALGPKQRALFDKLVAGDDLTSEGVSALTLEQFDAILSDAVLYLENVNYAAVMLEEVVYLRSDAAYNIPALTEQDYY